MSPSMSVRMERLREAVEGGAQLVRARARSDPKEIVVGDGINRGEPLPDRKGVHPEKRSLLLRRAADHGLLREAIDHHDDGGFVRDADELADGSRLLTGLHCASPTA